PDGKDYRETTEGFFLERGEDTKKLAQEYFEKAKKELGKDEITLRFLFEPSDPSKSAAEFMQSEFASLDGLNIEMVSQEKNVRLKTQQNGDFDLVLTRWGPDYADPTTYLNVLVPGGSFNFGKYDSDEYKKALDEAANASTDEARWDALKKAEKIAMEDVAVAPIFQTGASDLLNPSVKHLVDNPVGVPFVYKYVTIDDQE
ncbi:ABC transporter substrate-binding protein, partial [uncultured Dubosiella sp.]